MPQLSDLSELIKLSRLAGERFDLVQAGGGNSSTKLSDGKIYVKASGIALGDVKGESDFCQLDWQPLLKFVQDADLNMETRQLESAAAEVTKAAIQSAGRRPSIEVLMHCLFGPFTLHTHPIVSNIVTCREGWQPIIKEHFQSAILVGYKTPGAPLAVAINQALKSAGWQTGDSALVFLENHGLIVSAQTIEEVMELTDEVVSKIENELGLDFKTYRLTNYVSDIIGTVTGNRPIAFLSQDSVLADLLVNQEEVFRASPALPDQLVYCGPSALYLSVNEKEKAVAQVRTYLEANGAPPQVVVTLFENKKHLLMIGPTIRKCREIEEVLKSHAQILAAKTPSKPIKPLEHKELAHLANWDAEKYRKNL